MKRLPVGLLVLILVLFLASDAFARTGSRRSTIRVYGTTGGAAGDLDAIECEDIRGDDAATTDPLRDDDVAWGVVTTAGAHPQIYFWNFDEDVDNDNCTAANEPWDCCTGSGTGNCESTDEDDPRMIFPDDQADCVNANEGAWILGETYYLGRVATPSVVFRDADATDTDDNGYIQLNCTDTGSGTEDCDMTFYVQIAGTPTAVFTIDADGNRTVAGTLVATAFSGPITGAVTGNADTATALAANGGNCGAGEYPLGVDASGAVESCTDATTEINAEIGNVLDGTDAFTDLNATDIVDSDNYAADSIDNEHINWADIDYLGDEGAPISQTPMTDDCDNFLSNFTGNYLYGGTFLCNAAGTCTLPAVTAGMHFTIITVGAVACVIDPNGSDSMLTDGTQQADGENITNTSTAGDIAVVQYLSAAGWLVTTNGWTQE